MWRGLLFALGGMLLIVCGVMTAARLRHVDPYYLEFYVPDLVNGGLTACRQLYYDQPGECGYLDANHTMSLSPDGRWRVFARAEGLKWAIYRISVQRRAPEKIADVGNLSTLGLPAWSPDGEWLAFSAFRSDSSLDVFRVEVATGEIEPLTDFPGDEWFPAWSADGERIAFSAREPLGITRLYIMGADGSGLHEALPGLPQSFRPQWSPDGEWLLFQSNCPEPILRLLGQAPCTATHFDLYRLRLSDGHFEPLVALPGDDYDPVWTPDGKWIAFASREDNASPTQIFRVRPDGSDLQAITSDPNTDHFFPSWAKTIDLAWCPLFLLIIGFSCMIAAWFKSPRGT